ncbi:MAG: glyoxylate/hydroxypyruvate reductase A [Rhodospirillales bacterium]|jgi:glyoxylate/hydroxypyruvate reductase A|nr:glyoxylate/hydroxypyruvate reductase A [Rhodospirillales bacterium]
MAFLFGSRSHDAGKWVDELKRGLPEMEFRLWPDGVGDPADIEFTLVTGGKPGMYKDFPNLKAIFSFGAGVDHLMRDPDVPKDVPIGRGVNASLVQNMTHYVVHWVLHFHRGYHRYREFQGQAKWQALDFVYPSVRRVGILGLGALGTDAARSTAALGFPTAGWSRDTKSVKNVESFHGADQLKPFLARTDVLVCLLPLTPETTDIINAENLAALPEGAFLINPGRGSHAVEDDVRAALDSGHIEAAALDVFRTEPLPPDDPLWAHPRVYATPHVASRNEVDVAAAHHAENVRRVLAGELPRPLVDRARGY